MLVTFENEYVVNRIYEKLNVLKGRYRGVRVMMYTSTKFYDRIGVWMKTVNRPQIKTLIKNTNDNWVH